MTTLFLLLALLPAFCGFLITGDFSQYLYKPSRKQIYFVLKNRWYLIGASILLWTLGIICHFQVAPTSLWFLVLASFLTGLFITAGFFMPGYIMFRSIHQPKWISIAEADKHFPDGEPIIGLEINGDARAYPIDMILRPHMVNDVIGGEPISMSYCMLCNSAMAFKQEFEGKELKFITPLQWENNLMIYNPKTKHLVQQMTKKIVGGSDDGKEIESYPTLITNWAAWKQLHPNTKVFYHPPQKAFDKLARSMLRTKIHEPNMEQEAPIFPTIKRFDDRLPNKAAVLGVCVKKVCKAYSLKFLVENPILNDMLNDKALLVAYDAKLDMGDIFERQHNGQNLTFKEHVNDTGQLLLKDEETDSTWDITGKAISGKLKDSQLTPYTHYNRIYWYSWVNFFPHTLVDTISSETL